MANAPASPSPQLYARIGGLLYLLLIAVGFWAVIFVRGAVIVSGDAAATAHNIMASPALWRSGIAADLLMHMCDAIMLPPFIAELSLALWLDVKRVDVAKWQARVSA
jgi:ABC-type Na+ efflux pump permease subunit